MTARIPARSKRQAMDWSLVLVSQEIETSIDLSEELGWGLLIAESDHVRALNALEQYRTENRHWPWRRTISRQGVLFDWGSAAWVALICLFFWLSQRNTVLHDTGLMDATAVSHGQWWRLFTAMYLHADAAHLAANAGIGLLLLGLSMGRFGTGIGLLAAFLAGAGGNVAAWIIYPDGHRSLGASGMVMGCVGLLAAQSFSLPRNPQSWKYTVSGIAGGLMLFVLMGVAPGTDIVAHFGGFVVGVILGIPLALLPRFTQSPATNIFSGSAFTLLTILSWWLALKN